MEPETVILLAAIGVLGVICLGLIFHHLRIRVRRGDLDVSIEGSKRPVADIAPDAAPVPSTFDQREQTVGSQSNVAGSALNAGRDFIQVQGDMVHGDKVITDSSPVLCSSSYVDKVRDYAVLVYLSAAMRHLASELEDYEYLDEDDSWVEQGPPPESPLRKPEFAIARTKRIQNEIWRCELLTSMLNCEYLKRKLYTTLIQCHEAIAQADVPAELEYLEGNGDEAVMVCTAAISRAWHLCGHELSALSAKCSAEVKLLFSHGLDSRDVTEILGWNLEENNLNTISTLDLASIAESWHVLGEANPD